MGFIFYWCRGRGSEISGVPPITHVYLNETALHTGCPEISRILLFENHQKSIHYIILFNTVNQPMFHLSFIYQLTYRDIRLNDQRLQNFCLMSQDVAILSCQITQVPLYLELIYFHSGKFSWISITLINSNLHTVRQIILSFVGAMKTMKLNTNV